MTMHEALLTTDTASSSTEAASLSDWIRQAGTRFGTWVNTCADYYAAAAMYEQLHKLSDAELERRGFNRATLGRDVCGNL
jgi:hypothetical protein